MKQESIETLRSMLKALITFTVMLLGCSFTIHAQDTSSALQVEIKGIVGGVDFVAGDDQIIGHTLVGGAVRIYVSKRVAVEPEYLYMRKGASDHDQAFNLNVSYDFKDRSMTKYIPYLIGGGGFTSTRNRFSGVDFSNSTWTANFGGGLKIFLGKRFFVAPELRFGREPAFRTSVSIGYVISHRK
jgi:hypothetical protein